MKQITLSAVLFILPAEKSFYGSVAFSSFIHFISSSLQDARHVAYIKKKEPFMSEHLGNHTQKKILKLWKQMLIQAFAFDKYYHTHKKKSF